MPPPKAKKKDHLTPLWFNSKGDHETWRNATEFLGQDPILRGLMQRVGPCTLAPNRRVFIMLVKSILGQQVSVASAASMFRSLTARFPRNTPTPALMLELLTTSTPEQLAGCGLSRQKKSYLIDMSERFLSGEIKPARFAAMSDQEIIDNLLPIKGVGVWTVQMLLMFALNREDVWPIGDLGLRDALHRELKLPARPSENESEPLGDAWRPYRTIACWYLWRGKTHPPVVDETAPTTIAAKPKAGK